MAMSDCAKCWETPCVCGHDYQDRSEAWLKDQIAMLQRELANKQRKRVRVDRENACSCSPASETCKTATGIITCNRCGNVNGRIDVTEDPKS